MQHISIQFRDDHLTEWLGYGDFTLISPDGRHTVELTYAGEPPHGDSFHTAVIDGHTLPGLAWAGHFAISRCYRYIAFGWMAKRFQRKTVVVDMDARRFVALPEYIHAFAINWPMILGESSDREKAYTFDGTEHWLAY